MENNEKTPTGEAAETIFVLEDEAGEQYRVVQTEEVVVSVAMKVDIETRFACIRNVPYKEGDVLVCSYPKTGTHWTANLVHFLFCDGPLDDMISQRPNLIDLYPIDEVNQREGSRIFVSHFQARRLPTEHIKMGGKMILVFRNPKDTVVSHFHHMRKMKTFGECNLSWSSFIKYWLDGKIPNGSYFDYYNDWQEEMEKNPEMNVLIVQYEDLKTDPLNQLRRMQTYLGLNLPDERLQQVFERCSLGNLKADVDSGKLKTFIVDGSGRPILYRKGVVGDWKNHFTVAQNEIFEAAVNEKFQDSTFNYQTWN